MASSVPPLNRIGVHKRVSTVLLTILASIALVVLAGLSLIAAQLLNEETEIGNLRDRALPRLIKLSQLSQEASASIAIAPALSTNPTRFEFETLLSRLKDKRSSQADLLLQLAELIKDHETLESLKKNSALLAENQTALTTVVRQQINVRRRLEKHHEMLRKLSREVETAPSDSKLSGSEKERKVSVILRLQGVLLDPSRARFSRNQREIVAQISGLKSRIERIGGGNVPGGTFLRYWSEQGDRILADKTVGLANEFKIKALVEENSLIANRLLHSANAEFALSSKVLTDQIEQIASATRYNQIMMVLVFIAFAAGAFLLWFTLQRRVFRRLDNMREALRLYAESRENPPHDPAHDEIGEISRAIRNYMARIDKQEEELEGKNKDLESLSTRLAKYLSPQVYESIFSGKQQVTVTSSRKKLTVFFSDIVGFTELADQQESEELTQLLNTYLTEMSHIALRHGATIDKYIGDAIMVFFGDPETRGSQEDALQCVKMAIAMRERLSELYEDWQTAGISRPMVCRMGIHTGYCTVGNFGSDERMDYTIIGGTVNTASRLEAAAQPGEILTSYETYALVSNDIECSEQGQINVKGMAYPVTTYSVVGLIAPTKQRTGKLQQLQSGMHLEIDKTKMNAEERIAALNALKRAIRHIDE